jgi:hypothetical protein
MYSLSDDKLYGLIPLRSFYDKKGEKQKWQNHL